MLCLYTDFECFKIRSLFEDRFRNEFGMTFRCHPGFISGSDTKGKVKTCVFVYVVGFKNQQPPVIITKSTATLTNLF